MLSIRNLLIVAAIHLASLEAPGQDPSMDSLKSLLASGLDGRQKVDVLNQLSYFHYDVNDTLALHYAQEALSVSIKANYPAGIKYAYSLIGLGYSYADVKEAVRYFKLSDNLKVPNTERITVDNFMVWGNVYTELGKYDSALFYYRKARSFQILKINVGNLQSIYKNFAFVYINQWKNREAMQYLDSASSLSARAKDAFNDREVLWYFSLAHLNLLAHDKSKTYSDKLCQLASETNDSYHLIECRLMQSRQHYQQGESHASLLKALEAFALTKTYYYAPQYVDVLIQVSKSYLELAEYGLSAQYLFQALKLSETKGFDHRTATIKNIMAWLFQFQNKDDQAMKNIEQAQILQNRIDDKNGQVAIFQYTGVDLF